MTRVGFERVKRDTEERLERGRRGVQDKETSTIDLNSTIDQPQIPNSEGSKTRKTFL